LLSGVSLLDQANIKVKLRINGGKRYFPQVREADDLASYQSPKIKNSSSFRRPSTTLSPS